MKNPQKAGVTVANDGMPSSATASGDVFDGIAMDYDEVESRDAVFQWMRRRVHSAAMESFASRARLLEIGCGTGADALFFASRGFRLLAVDPSPKMLEVAHAKLVRAGFAGAVELRLGGAEQTEELVASCGQASFDGIFSNFGALNCVADLRPFVRAAAALLRPNGKILLNLMPPICPWEIFYFLLKLKPHEAFRRWRGRSGTQGLAVRLGKQRVQTFYHSPAVVLENFSSDFRIEQRFALGLFVPPPYLQKITRQRKLFDMLLRYENIMAGWPLLRNWGDHAVIILRKRGHVDINLTQC